MSVTVSSTAINNLTVPSDTGTFLSTESTVPPKVPAFIANTTSTTSFSTAIKVPFDTVVLDTDSWFDTTNYRYTPQQAGYYFIDFMFQTSGSGTPTYGLASLRKNGTEFQGRFLSISNNQFNSVSVSGFVELNGSTDYVEGYAQMSTTRSLRNGYVTQLKGFLVRTT